MTSINLFNYSFIIWFKEFKIILLWNKFSFFIRIYFDRVKFGITAKFLSDGEIRKLKEQKILNEENAEIERAKKESLNYV